MVAECRKVNGARAARDLWRALGLPGAEPEPTPLTADQRRWLPLAEAVLQHFPDYDLSKSDLPRARGTA